jgi:hypothetical protein
MVPASRYSSQIGLDSIISKEEELLFVLPRTNRDRKNKKRWWRYCFERGADGSILYLEWERREIEGAAVLCVYCRRNLVGHALACLLLRVWSGCVWVWVGGAFPFSGCGLWRAWVARTGKRRGQARQVQVRVLENPVKECRG